MKKPLLFAFSILILAGCQTPQQPSSSFQTSLNENASPEQRAWSFLREVEKSRPKEVNAYRVCHINADNSVSDLFYEQGKSFMDADIPSWKDGETISSVANPGEIQMKLRKLGAMWAVQLVFQPDNKHRCVFKDNDDKCNPSWCNLGMSSGKIKPAETEQYLSEIAAQAKLLGMKVVHE
ncbi:lipoprotein [Neptunicella sp. SCSIO 80796]|uniref:lipoprotein n=1 Tax=Neptunicella plasticusilytica TaxID=3117012 RepID=UPI003A4D203A